MRVRYDMRCGKCGYVEEVVRASGDTHEMPCPVKKCGGSMSWMPTVQANRDWISEANPIIHEHLGHEPVKLTSKEQYRKELQKRGLRHRDFNHGENLSEV